MKFKGQQFIMSRAAVRLMNVLTVFILLASLLANAYQYKLYRQKIDNSAQTSQSKDDRDRERYIETTRPVLKGHAYTGYFVQNQISTKRTYFVKREAEKSISYVGSTPLIEDGVHSATLVGSDTIVFVDGDYSLKSININTEEVKTVAEANVSTGGDGLDSQSFSSVLASPDGKWLLLGLAYYEGSGVGIMRGDGTDFQKLDYKNAGLVTSTDWSEDSRYFALARDNSDFAGETGGLYVASPDKPNDGKQLIPTDTAKRSPDQTKNTYDVRFSPDGSKLAFGYQYKDVDRDPNSSTENAEAPYFREIYTVNVDGSDFKAVTQTGTYAYSPFWKDNQTLYYQVSNFYFGRTQGLRELNIVTGQEKTLLPSGTGDILSYGFDANTLLVRNVGPHIPSADSWPSQDIRLININDEKQYEFIDYSRVCYTAICPEQQ